MNLTWDNVRQLREQRNTPFIVAHRGAQTREPENTLAAFTLAVAQGADALETDLHFTRDNQIVLIHDATIDRTTNGSGRVSQMTLAELQTFRTRRPGNGSSSSLSDEPVPTLRALIEATDAQVPLLLELKDSAFLQPERAQQLVDLLTEMEMLARGSIVSFQYDRVKVVQQIQPALATGIISRLNPLPLGDARLLGPLWPLIYLNPFYTRWAHAQGKFVCPLDPTPEARVGGYLRLGVDALLANDPASVVAAIEQAR